MKAQADRELVATLAALAQGTRIAIMRLVSPTGENGIAAGEIARSTDTPPSTLSFHLKEMTQAGLLKARNQGRFIYYSLADKALLEAVAFLNDCLGAAQPPPQEPPAPERRPAARPKRSRGGQEGADDGPLNIFGD